MSFKLLARLVLLISVLMPGAITSGSEAQEPHAFAAADVTPPTLVAFDFTPKTVDTSTTSQDIVFTARITDAPAGLGFPYSSFALFESPSGEQRLEAQFYPPTKLISGNGQDGIYRDTVTLPAFAEAEQGTWRLDRFGLTECQR
jgi:hypothetical protein